MKLTDAKNIVVKIGTAAITTDNDINKREIDRLAYDISIFQKESKNIIIVTSGAIAMGRRVAKVQARDDETLQEKQRYAALGQPVLMQHYIDSFSKYNLRLGQLLIVEDDLDSRLRLKNLRATINELQKNKDIAVFNENDAIATSEITFGDNDLLAAYLTRDLKQDALIKLGVYDGLLRNGKVVKRGDSFSVKDYDDLNNETKEGRGGLESTLKAAEIAVNSGRLYVVANIKNCLMDIIRGDAPATVFFP